LQKFLWTPVFVLPPNRLAAKPPSFFAFLLCVFKKV
jgi:hypothetical protein